MQKYTTTELFQEIEATYATRSSSFTAAVEEHKNSGKSYEDRERLIADQNHRQKRLLDASHGILHGLAPTAGHNLLNEVIEELRREHSDRCMIFPRLVAAGKMRREDQLERIRIWRAIVAHFESPSNTNP
jgi:hypothetical protein